MSKHCYTTWSRQVGAPVIDVDEAVADEFLLRDGRRIFDFLSTSFQASFGHSHPLIIDRIKHQTDVLSIAVPKAEFPLKHKVTERLLERLRLGEGRIFYTVGGAESVENALKIARHWTGRRIVLARKRSYHGASLGAMSVSGDWRSDPHVNFSAGTVRIPEPDDDPRGDKTREIILTTGPQEIAAVIVETITGANGVIVPPQSWWDAIQELCREFGILLISDEVLCGFGRTGPDFGFHHFGLRPDLVCLSKAITGGYVPFGAVWTSERVAARYDQEVFACGLTNYAHPLGLAACDAVLDILQDPSFQKEKQTRESQFAAWLDGLRRHPRVTSVRFQGMLAAIDLNLAAPTWSDLIARGVHAYTRGNSIVLAPPLNADAGRLDIAMRSIAASIDEATADSNPTRSKTPENVR